MAITHSTLLQLLIRDTETFPSPAEGGPILPLSQEVRLTHGTGAGQADVVASATYIVGISGTQTLDFNAGGFTEQDGSVATFAKIKALAVVKLAGSGAASLQRPAANGAPMFVAASDGLASLVDTGAFLVLYYGDTGITVTAGTGDLLSIVETGGAATVTVRVYVIGTSA